MHRISLLALVLLGAASAGNGEIVIRLKDGRSVSVPVNKEDVEAIIFKDGGSGGGRGGVVPGPDRPIGGMMPQPSPAQPGVAPPAQGAGTGKVRIISCRFGAAGKYCDAATRLQHICNGESSCKAPADGSLCGDPAPGVVKELTVEYSCGGAPVTLRAREGQTLLLRCQ